MRRARLRAGGGSHRPHRTSLVRLAFETVRSLWWSRRAIGLHAALVVALPGFFVLFWWQLHRALSGNDLSWAYTFEWPFFAAYAVWMWWRLVHEPSAEPARSEIGGAASRRERPGRQQSAEGNGPVAPPEDDSLFDPYDESEPELAAYNRYLAGLHAADRRKRF